MGQMNVLRIFFNLKNEDRGVKSDLAVPSEKFLECRGFYLQESRSVLR
jgi:hypothetical protein